MIIFKCFSFQRHSRRFMQEGRCVLNKSERS